MKCIQDRAIRHNTLQTRDNIRPHRRISSAISNMSKMFNTCFLGCCKEYELDIFNARWTQYGKASASRQIVHWLMNEGERAIAWSNRTDNGVA